MSCFRKAQGCTKCYWKLKHCKMKLCQFLYWLLAVDSLQDWKKRTKYITCFPFASGIHSPERLIMLLTLMILIVQDESDMSHLEICCCRGLSSPASCRNVSNLFHGLCIIFLICLFLIICPATFLLVPSTLLTSQTQLTPVLPKTLTKSKRSKILRKRVQKRLHHFFNICNSTTCNDVALQESSYCGLKPMLKPAEPSDMLIVCSEYSLQIKPESTSVEEEVVLFP